MRNIFRAPAALAVSALTFVASPVLAQSGEVNIYSYREPGLIQPLLDRFTEETGISTSVLFAGDGLIERAAAEGELSPVDVVRGLSRPRRALDCTIHARAGLLCVH
jgi:hypothetical protein